MNQGDTAMDRSDTVMSQSDTAIGQARRTSIMRRVLLGAVVTGAVICGAVVAGSAVFGSPGVAAATAATRAVPAHSKPAATVPPKPHIIQQLIAFGAKRRAQTVKYNRIHYGQATWRLKPKVIVLHYTAGGTEASTHALFNANQPNMGVLPGVVAHFIIDKNGKIYQQLALNIRGRHTVGLNQVSIGIEFVQKAGRSSAWAANQIIRRKPQIKAGLKLVRWLQWRYHIKVQNVTGHGIANKSPYFKDRLHWRNTHVDWLGPAVSRFRVMLRF